MARYELRFRKSVSKDLDPIPKRDVQRIIEAVRALAEDPRPPQSRKLSGAEKYRLRCGVYRVLYEIQDDVLVVCIVKVGHRKDVYRN
ncbi:MAG: type II toxin-antitoxin system RelE/ParE family toxin [Kiritimatiellae bacterium]|nr:type II toxin-antitoxin system RelE/ParE family toxin [Kiritimatiellia bacterium]